MSGIYEILGRIVFWLIAAILWLICLDGIGRFWTTHRFRIWPFQVYEYYKFKRLYAKNGMPKWTLPVLKIHRNRFLGDNREGYGYRKKHLFQKQIVKMLDDMINKRQREYEETGAL